MSSDGQFDWSAQVRGLRHRLAQTQQSFAFDLGVARETVSRWESGADEPSVMWKRKLIKLVEQLDSRDTLDGLIDTVETSTGLVTLLDRDFRIVRTSAGHQQLSSFDVRELYGKESERFWSAEMRSVMDKIGGVTGYRKRRIRRLDLKLEVIREPGQRGYRPNSRLFTAGTTITWGPAHAPVGYLTQMRLETVTEPALPMIKTFGSEELRPLE